MSCMCCVMLDCRDCRTCMFMQQTQNSQIWEICNANFESNEEKNVRRAITSMFLTVLSFLFNPDNLSIQMLTPFRRQSNHKWGFIMHRKTHS